MTRLGVLLGALLALACLAPPSDAGWPSSGRKYSLTSPPSQLITQTDYTLGSLGSGDSDTRSTTATYVNCSTGYITSAAINTARFDCTGGTAHGWLVEAAATNFVLQSQALGTTWSNTCTTVTNNFAVSPDGTSNATRLNCPATTWAVYQFTGGASNTYTISMYVEYNNASFPGFRLFLNGSGLSSNFTATSSFVRYSYSLLQPGPSNLGIARNSSVAAADLIVFGAQVEAGTYATSYIPTTTTTITRAADVAANAGWTTNYLMVESTNEGTGVTSRATYCASGCTGTTFTPSAVWIKRICQFNATSAGKTAANAARAQANGTACS